MRREEPVHFSPHLQAWFVTRYDDILAALHDKRLSAGAMTGQIDRLPPAERAQLSRLRDCIALWMGHTNDADHVRMQKLFKRYFTPRTIESLRPGAQQILDQILAPIAPRGEMELVSEVAYPFPAWVIANMLGVPPTDYAHFQRWSHDISNVFRRAPFEQLLESQRGLGEMTDYMATVVARHRSEIHEDLISVMIEAQSTGMIASEAEILANCSLILFAGHETTANLIANGMVLLFDNPESFARLRENRELLPSAIEEMLRLDGPATMTTRVAVEDLELGGRTIKSGQLLFLVLNSGNRDERKFERGDAFELAREGVKSHLGFGMGSFYCLGAALARMEAQLCFTTLFDKLPNLRPGAGERKVETSVPLNRQFKAIPIAWDPA
jgi:cytochrome P450